MVYNILRSISGCSSSRGSSNSSSSCSVMSVILRILAGRIFNVKMSADIGFVPDSLMSAAAAAGNSRRLGTCADAAAVAVVITGKRRRRALDGRVFFGFDDVLHSPSSHRLQDLILRDHVDNDSDSSPSPANSKNPSTFVAECRRMPDDDDDVVTVLHAHRPVPVPRRAMRCTKLRLVDPTLPRATRACAHTHIHTHTNENPALMFVLRAPHTLAQPIRISSKRSACIYAILSAVGGGMQAAIRDVLVGGRKTRPIFRSNWYNFFTMIPFR